MRKRGDDDTVHAAFLDLLVYLLFVLYRVAAQLSHRALADRVIQNEEVEVAQPLPLLHAHFLNVFPNSGNFFLDFAHVSGFLGWRRRGHCEIRRFDSFVYGAKVN